MDKNPLEFIKEIDQELFSSILSARKLAFNDSALSGKNKLLIALALDASRDAINGVKYLAKQAIEAGATKEEIMDTLRVVYYISGVGSIYTAAVALNDLF